VRRRGSCDKPALCFDAGGCALSSDGGESLSEFFTRIEHTLSGILARHRSGAILIVGHGATNQMIVRSLFHLTLEQAAAFQQSNEDLYLCDLSLAKRARLWKLVDPVP
jgi:broad specificity phosphatase PhoE